VSTLEDIEVLRDRVRRASEVRESIGKLWNEYLSQHHWYFGLIPDPDSDTRWTLVIRTVEPLPVRISTLFGEWLYLLRAALDGTMYYVAIRDSGQNPPPNEKSLYFPIMTDAAKFDSPTHRGSLSALRDSTFADLRCVQPFNSPDHRANILWWINELARIDRHRRGHSLAAHIDRTRIGTVLPVTALRHRLFESSSSRVPIDETTPVPILDLKAPAYFDEQDVIDHLDINAPIENVLDVTRWYRESSPPMSSTDLSRRMMICEWFIGKEIIAPILDGEV
jgi:hypothetical protein